MIRDINTRVSKIKSDRTQLLKMVRDNILEHKDSLSDKIDEINDVLKIEEVSSKKYEAMISAQEMIAQLTEEILNAKTTEEILKIRKKLNYYINKIKAELKRRGFEENEISKYCEKVSSLRTDIAQYIRFIKREENIIQIDSLYSNYDNLTIEQKETLKKALRREMSYNTRNLNSDKEKKETIKTSEDSISCQVSKRNLKNIFYEDLEFLYGNNKKNTNVNKLIFDFDDSNNEQTCVENEDAYNYVKCLDSSENITYEQVKDFLEEKAKNYCEQYNIASTFDYHSHRPFRNAVNFFRNIPSFIHNKKVIKLMERDFNIFYHGNDLASFIEYQRERNSIHQSLRCIFEKTYLYSREAHYLNCQEKCSKWLYVFCKKNNMDLPLYKNLVYNK